MTNKFGLLIDNEGHILSTDRTSNYLYSELDGSERILSSHVYEQSGSTVLSSRGQVLPINVVMVQNIKLKSTSLSWQTFHFKGFSKNDLS